MSREEFLRQEIARCRKKIETYLAMISEWESELGITTQAAQQTAPVEMSNHKKASNAGDPLSIIQGLVFFNKSQTEAAKALLEMVGYPLTTDQLLEGIEKGGVKVGGKTPTTKKQNLYTILNRSTGFGRAARNTWGLIGWPGIAQRTVDDNEDSPPTTGDDGKNETTSEKEKNK